jgi:hypothetical protein
MKRLLGLLVLVLLVGFGYSQLKEATEYTGREGKAGTNTTFTFQVKTKNFHHPDAVGATALWQACVSSLNWDSDTQPVAISPGLFRASVEPALAGDTKRRLRGCLNEATVDRIQGEVKSTVDNR